MERGGLLSLALCLWTTTAALQAVAGVNLEGALYQDLMTDYNKNVRPTQQSGSITQVTLKMTLTNLISLNEKEEALTTSVWMEMQWCDYRLRWDQPPRSGLYGNITFALRVPSKSIWLPDIVLENNVDGQFEVAQFTNALVSSDGCVYWLPPAIYRSACSITIDYFPFDWQNCSMVFRSQTYSANEVQLVLTEEDGQPVEWVVIDPEAFTENGEWAIKHRPARKVVRPDSSPESLEHQELVFYLLIHRKPLFYVINIIVPCVLFSSLGLLVYFLPAKAGGQKCFMSVATLLGQTVFLILIAKKVPETSKAVPLIGKYLMFVMSVTTMVVMNCVIVLNVSLRTPSTHQMTDTVRKILLNILPRLLRMQMRPWTPEAAGNRGDETGGSCDGNRGDGPFPRRRSSLGLMAKAEEYVMKTARSELMFSRLRERNGLVKTALHKIRVGVQAGSSEHLEVSLAQASPELQECVSCCRHMAQSAREHTHFQSENEEWFLVARVIDRVCFVVMALMFFLGTVGIFLTGHFNQPPPTPFPGDPRLYLPPPAAAAPANLTSGIAMATPADLLG